MRIFIYKIKHNKRSEAVVDALQRGIAQRPDDHVYIELEENYKGPIKEADVVCFYGLAGNLMQIFKDYRAMGTQTVFLDLGVWGRKGEKYPDYHRVAINDYQPTAYFQQGATPERFLVFERQIQPWQYDGEEILVAGMSERASQVWGLGHATDHARAMIEEIRRHTNRPIAYRSKPSWMEAVPIEGTRYAMGPLNEELRKAWMVITYRSNVSVDGLIAGVPCIVLGDHPALVMSHNDLTRIEDPLRLPDPARLQFCSDLAWQQFSLREMRTGYMWKTILKHGLIKTKNKPD